MGLFNWSFRSGGDEVLRGVAEQIVHGCLNEVLQRTSGMTTDMLPAEARGYIRTRSAKVVNREIAVLCATDRNLRSLDRTRLAGLVTEMLITAVANRRRQGSRTIAA